MILNVKPLSPIDVANYTLILKVAEVDAPSYYSIYYLYLTVLDPNATDIPQNESSLTGKVQGYSTDGSVTIVFN